jgi:lysophospholipase L1-like esterase
MSRFPLSSALTIATLGALLAIAPKLAPAIKPPQLGDLAALADFSPERTPMSPLVRRVAEPPQPAFHLRLNGAAAPLLDDANGGLDHFYQALARTERREPGAVTRATHYGDSPTTADLITGDIREMLQTRFGDAGHGFVLIAKPWAWYQHRGIWLSGSGWSIFPATQSELRDRMYGLGGVTFLTDTGARTRFALDDPGQSHFELYFERQAGGGTVGAFANGFETPIARMGTTGDAAPGFASFDVPGGAKTIELRADGPVRLFGLTAEKPGPGVVYDSIGLNGASVTVLSRIFNAAHWASELQHRNPDLVTINYGTNEADFTDFIDKDYEKELREAIRRARAALPAASILVMSPMDRGYRGESGDIETMETIPRIVEIQRRVAADTGCGFFDTFAAMGGAGTMSRWYDAQPRLVSADFIHPYPAGGKIIAGVFVKQIEAGLARYKLRRLQQ